MNSKLAAVYSGSLTVLVQRITVLMQHYSAVETSFAAFNGGIPKRF
jgi:hypothetical protein